MWSNVECVLCNGIYVEYCLCVCVCIHVYSSCLGTVRWSVGWF